MRLQYIFLAFVVLTIVWEIRIEAKYTDSSGKSQRTTSRNPKTATNNDNAVVNQVGWRFNVTSYSSQYSRNDNKTTSPITKQTSVPRRNSSQIYNSTSVNTVSRNSTKLPSRNSTQINYGSRNNTKVNLPNRSLHPSIRNSTHINQGRLNTTIATIPNHVSSPPSRNTTHINQGRANRTRISPQNRGPTPSIGNSTHINTIGYTNSSIISNKKVTNPNHDSSLHTRNSTTFNTGKVAPPNHGSAPINRNQNNLNIDSHVKTNPNHSPPPVIIYVPITSSPPKKKEPGFKEAFLDSLQKELTKSKKTTTTVKPKITAKPLTKKKQTIVKQQPSTTKAPIETTLPPPYPAVPLASFHNTQPPQVLYLPGGPFGYYVCNNPGQQATSFDRPLANPQGFVYGQLGSAASYIQPGQTPQRFAPYPSDNRTTSSYVQTGHPPYQQGPEAFQSYNFYNDQNLGNSRSVRQQSFGQPAAKPQGVVYGQSGSADSYTQPGQVPQGFVNVQTVYPGSNVQPGYVQYPATISPQNFDNSQTATNGLNAAQPQNFGQPDVIPQGFQYGQLITASTDKKTNQTLQDFSNGQVGFINATQGAASVQTPVYTNPQNYGNDLLSTNRFYAANQHGFDQQVRPNSLNQPGQFGAAGLPLQTVTFNSNFQTNSPSHYFSQPGQPVSPVPVTATQQFSINGLPIAPGTPQPYVYGPQGQICSFVYNQPGVAGTPTGFLQQPHPANNPQGFQYTPTGFYGVSNSQAEVAGTPPGIVQQPLPANIPQGFPNTETGSFGVFPTVPNNSFPTAGQYQSYPMWPNAAFPNVQPNTLNVPQGFAYWQNGATQKNTTSSGSSGINN